jgi:hypothetical protein
MNTLNILSAIATVGVNAVVNSNTVASTPKKKRSRYSQRDGESFVAWQTRLSELRADARDRVRKHREEQRNAVSDLATQMIASVKVISEDDANGKTYVESDNVVKALDLSHDDVVRIAAASLLSPGETREVIVSQLTAKFSTAGSGNGKGGFGKAVGKRTDLSQTRLLKTLRDLRVYRSMGEVNRKIASKTPSGDYAHTGYAYDPLLVVSHRSPQQGSVGIGFVPSNMEVFTRSELMESDAGRRGFLAIKPEHKLNRRQMTAWDELQRNVRALDAARTDNDGSADANLKYRKALGRVQNMYQAEVQQYQTPVTAERQSSRMAWSTLNSLTPVNVVPQQPAARPTVQPVTLSAQYALGKDADGHVYSLYPRQTVVRNTPATVRYATA